MPALRTDTLHDMAVSRGRIARRHDHCRHGHAVEAKCALALLAEEVHVQVIVLIMAMAVAQLVVERTVAIVDGMHQMAVTEE